MKYLHIVLSVIVLALPCQPLRAGEVTSTKAVKLSTYYSGLEKEFTGIGPARFVGGNNEDEALNRVVTGGGMETYWADKKRKLLKGIAQVKGQVFDRAASFVLEEKANKYWDVSFCFNNTQTVRKGESILIVFWAKGKKAPQIVDDGLGATVQTYIYTNAIKAHKGRISNFYDTKMLTTDWVRYYVKTGPVSQDFAPGELSLIGMMGHKAQTIEVGGFAWMVFPEGAKLENMPKPDWNYEGRAPDAPWREEAKKRIEKYRKGNLMVKVVDEKGLPVSDARVHFQMQKHAFYFGVAVGQEAFKGKWKGMTSDDIEKYRQVSSTYFNRIVIDNGLKWDYIEWRRKDNWQEAKDCLKYYHGKGLNIRGHVLVWPTIYRIPEPLRSKFKANPELLGPAIKDHIREVVTEFKPWIADWDVTNETDVCRDFMDNLGPEAMLDWYRIAKETNPKLTLTFNEPSFGSEGMEIGSFPKKMLSKDCRGWVEYLVKNNAPLDYLGSQCHGGRIGRNYGGKTGPEGLWLYLDDFYKRYGKKLQYTELDVSVGDTTDQDQLSYQADRLRDTIIIAFAHPSFVSITQWGFWAGAHYRPNAALWNRDWTLRKNGQAYVDLVTKRWWTDDIKKTGKDGVSLTRAFYGTYELSVDTPDGKKGSITCDFSEGDTTRTVTIK